MRIIAATLLFASTFTFAAAAEPKPLTVGECMNVARGLRALERAGLLLDEQPRPDPAAKQYKLGAARITIGMNLAALGVVVDGVERTRRALVLEISPDKAIAPGSAEMEKLLAQLQDVLDKPCPVMPGRLKVEELKIGDGPDENAFPPSVIGALAPILDR